MKKLSLSTNLIGLDGTFCTYWGRGKTEDTIHEDCIEQDFYNGDTDVHPDYYFMNFDNDKYMEDWNDSVQDFVEGYLCDIFKDVLSIDIKYSNEGYESPREYNFSHDVSYFDISADSFDKLVEYCLNHKDFADFLRRNYTSYDGFLSHTSNNTDDFENDIKEDDMTAWGAAVRFLIFENGMEDELEYCYEIFTDMFYTEYVDYKELDDWKESLELGIHDIDREWKIELFKRDISKSGKLKEIVEYNYKDMTIKQNVEDVLNKFELDKDTYTDVVTEMVKDIYKEIENYNLKLNL
jgi:hypothetical protein